MVNIMTKLTKQQKLNIAKVLAGFEHDGHTDFNRMRADILSATELRIDQPTTWSLVNRSKALLKREASVVPVVSFLLSDLD
jgi:hypothetical protein